MIARNVKLTPSKRVNKDSDSNLDMSIWSKYRVLYANLACIALQLAGCHKRIGSAFVGSLPVQAEFTLKLADSKPASAHNCKLLANAHKHSTKQESKIMAMMEQQSRL